MFVVCADSQTMHKDMAQDMRWRWRGKEQMNKLWN